MLIVLPSALTGNVQNIGHTDIGHIFYILSKREGRKGGSGVNVEEEGRKISPTGLFVVR